MPKLKSIEDLKKVREQAQQDFKIRIETNTKIIIGMGTCGIAAGARETMHAILEELQKAGDRRPHHDRRLHRDVLEGAAGRH